MSGKGAQSLGSVLSIAKMSKDSFFRGHIPLLSFMAILSLNLGVINLLPIPMLDGGHIVFYLYEYIFGKPIPEKVLAWLYKTGFAVLISVMLFTMWNDLMRFKVISTVVQLFK
ncbi:MAG: site-2 protease family protein [Holosporaceae bacterium]|nr:MAG: site-2 protease family protein [Holosporaceae bacterium]